ncbi:MAG: DUF3108 domain-containing protein [Burkholderiaceae bacterium]
MRAHAAVEFRTLVAQAPDPLATAPTVEQIAALPAPPAERRVVPVRRPRTAAQPVARPRIETPVEANRALPAALAAADLPAPSLSVVEQPAPLHRTVVPPSAQLRYRVERGERVGNAELSWQVLDGVYEARLEIVYEGSQRLALRRISQVSQGRIDAAGVAPQRHTERRPRAGMQAVNFERDSGEVSFSGPSWRIALAAGAQDGLSWMLQLAAVAQAEPDRATAGGEIVLAVVGIRGESRPWRFRFEAIESLPRVAGAVVLAKWVREPSEPYDARIEVWLDPTRHHLPVRLRSGALEMVLVE